MPARRPLIVAALLALAGCSLPGAEGAECEVDEDCDRTEDLGCWEGTCQRLAEPAGSLAFEVIPRASGGLAPAAFASLAAAPELTICPPERVAGTLELPAAHPVDVVAVGTTPVPGLERRLTAVLPAEPGGTDPRPFSLSLPPARWRIRFASRDGATPPLFASIQVPGCAPVPVRAVSAAGRYARAVPLRFGPGPLGHCGAAVQAFDPTSGEPLSAEVESRSDGDRCPDRALSLWVDAVDEVRDLVLRVRPATAGAAVAAQELPFRSHPGGDLCPPDVEPPCPTTVSIDLVPPDGEEPTRLAPVTVLAEDAGGLPLAAGAVQRIEALGRLDGVPRVCDADDRCGWGQGSVPATFFAREMGPGPAVTIPLLLPGAYGFTLIPSTASGLAVATVPAAAIGEDPVRIRLAPKVVATGTVSFEGRPLRALVRAEPQGPLGRPATVETGDDGHYAVALDPGPYRLDVRPRDPFRSVPWWSVPLPEELARLDVAMPARARVQGRARSGDGPVAGAVVRVFRCEPTCGDEGATAFPVGETITRDDGSFAVLVPGN